MSRAGGRKTVWRLLKAGGALCLLASVAAPSVAHAYVDPGSGSVIVTAILGAIGAIAYTCRGYVQKVKQWLARGRRERNDS